MLKRNYFFLFSFFLFAASLLFSCKKDPIATDAELTKDFIGDGFVVDEDFTITSVNKKETYLKGKNRIYSPLGVISDPVFGKVSSNIYLNFELASSNVRFGEGSLTLDSVVLNIPYLGSYGKNTIPVKIDVYELSEQISIVSTDSFSTDKTFSTNASPVASIANYIPKVNDSIYTSYGTLVPSFRVRLSDNLGQNILNQSGQSTLTDNASFQTFFKGLLISSLGNSNGDGVAYLGLTEASAKITLYYKDNGTAKQYDFRTGTSNSAFVNNYVNDRTSSSAEQQINAGVDSMMYLSGMSGYYTELSIPKLDSIKNRAISKAILELIVIDSVYGLAPRILAEYVDNSGNINSVTDFNYYDGYTHYDGAPTKQTNSSGQTVYKYKINLTRFIQGVSFGTIKPAKILLHVDSKSLVSSEKYYKDYRGYRMVLGGGTGSRKIKLHLTYTKTI